MVDQVKKNQTSVGPTYGPEIYGGTKILSPDPILVGSPPAPIPLLRLFLSRGRRNHASPARTSHQLISPARPLPELLPSRRGLPQSFSQRSQSTDISAVAAPSLLLRRSATTAALHHDTEASTGSQLRLGLRLPSPRREIHHRRTRPTRAKASVVLRAATLLPPLLTGQRDCPTLFPSHRLPSHPRPMPPPSPPSATRARCSAAPPCPVCVEWMRGRKV
jgi:hypothetical protein